MSRTDPWKADLTDSEAQIRGKSSRWWWWLPDWLWHGIVTSVIVLALKRVGERILEVGFRRIVSAIANLALAIIPFVAGFVFMEAYIRYFDTPTVLATGLVIAGVFIVRDIVLHRRAKYSLQNTLKYDNFRFSLCRGIGIGFNFVVGVVLKIIYVLGIVLYSFLSNPNVLVIFGVYGFFLADVLALKLLTSRVGGRYRRNTNVPRGLWF